MTNITKEYLDYCSKHSKDYGDNIIVLLKVGAFFEMYGVKDKNDNVLGSNVEDICKICDLQLSERSNMFYNKMPVLIAGFRDYTIEKYVQIITNNNYICFVYEQFEDKDKKKFYRKLTNIYSKGTYFEISNNNLNNVIMSIWIHKISTKIIFGVSHVNILNGKSYIYEYEENYILSPTMVDNLERYISIYRPNEIIIITNLDKDSFGKVSNIINFETDNIRSIFTHGKERFSIEAQNCEKQTYIKNIICQIFNPKDYNSFIEDYYYNTISLQSYCFLLNWISNHNDSLISKIEPPILEQTSEILHLANHSLKQLNIINNDSTKKNTSLLSMLNNCLTPMGKRSFTNILLHPITNIEKLHLEYDYTEKILSDYDLIETIREHIKNICDLEKYQRQLYLKKITLRNVIKIYDNLNSLYKLYSFINTNYNFLISYLDNSLDNSYLVFEKCKNIIAFLDKSLNITHCKVFDNLNDSTFKTGYNTNLDDVINETNQYFNNFKSIQDYIQDIFITYEKKNLQYVKIHTTDKSPPTLICTKKRSEILKKHFEKNTSFIVNDSIKFDGNFSFSKSSSGNVSIDHSVIQKTSQNYLSKKNLLDKTLEDVFSDFLEDFKQYHEDYIEIVKFASIIDVLQNKVYMAKKYNYIKPKIDKTENSFIDIKGLRHPILERINQDEIYVKNDISLNTDRHGILLFGTNAVGKTSFMKAIGICIIMAQSGLFVPCDKMIYSPYSQMFTRILNNDNMFKGLSTFAVEMSELRIILQRADNNSMVLGDELCSGTEYESASSIFVTGIEWLEKKKSSFIFATHLHNVTNFEEIKNLEYVTCNHMSVIYDVNKDCLIYDRILKEGSGNSIYGLEVCKSLHLPNEFIENCYEIRSKYFKKDKYGFLSNKNSRYNSKKILSICEICKINQSTEVHHLNEQRNANNDNFIEHFHKNNLANLTSICEDCHDNIHKNNLQLKRIKTTNGYTFSLKNNNSL